MTTTVAERLIHNPTPQILITAARGLIYSPSPKVDVRKRQLLQAFELLTQAAEKTCDYSVETEALLERGICFRKLGRGDMAVTDFIATIQTCKDNGLLERQIEGWLELSDTLRVWDELGGEKKRLGEAWKARKEAQRLIHSKDSAKLNDNLKIKFFLSSSLLYRDIGKLHNQAACYLNAGDLYAKQSEAETASTMYSLVEQVCRKFAGQPAYQDLINNAQKRMNILAPS